jgi:hypothetical protein
LKISIWVLMPVFAVNSATRSRMACDHGWLLSIRLMDCPSFARQLNSCAFAGKAEITESAIVPNS